MMSFIPRLVLLLRCTPWSTVSASVSLGSRSTSTASLEEQEEPRGSGYDHPKAAFMGCSSLVDDRVHSSDEQGVVAGPQQERVPAEVDAASDSVVVVDHKTSAAEEVASPVAHQEQRPFEDWLSAAPLVDFGQSSLRCSHWGKMSAQQGQNNLGIYVSRDEKEPRCRSVLVKRSAGVGEPGPSKRTTALVQDLQRKWDEKNEKGRSSPLFPRVYQVLSYQNAEGRQEEVVWMDR